MHQDIIQPLLDTMCTSQMSFDMVKCNSRTTFCTNYHIVPEIQGKRQWNRCIWNLSRRSSIVQIHSIFLGFYISANVIQFYHVSLECPPPSQGLSMTYTS